ncbi:MAG: hypothetical protein IJL19_06545 [Clostridiales bacterium]|nr:hypothetical protein [Clostridiales bacterium]
MQNTGIGRSLKKSMAGILLASMALAVCSCAVASKSTLVKYGKDNYGDCKYISQTRDNLNGTERRVVVLEDNATGIQYEVTSKKSSDSKSAVISSNFDGLYVEYLVKTCASDEIEALKDEYHFTFDYEYGMFNINFIDRGSSDNAELVPEEFDKIIAKYDDRNLRPVTYHIYVNSTAYIGSYNASDKTYTANG